MDASRVVERSDEWWLLRLLNVVLGSASMGRVVSRATPIRRLGVPESRWDALTRVGRMDLLNAHYEGNAPFLRVDEAYAQGTAEFLRMTRNNYAFLIVSSLQDRTQVVGGQTPDDEDVDGDDRVREFIEANGPFFADTLRHTYVLGTGGILVGPPADDEDTAIATPIDPRSAAWEMDPLNPRRVVAFLRLLRTDGMDRAYLHLPAGDGLPDRCRRASCVNGSWDWDEPSDYVAELPVQGLGVPFVPFVNELEQGEFERSLDVIDRIRNDVADRLWAAKFLVFFMRAFIGEFPEEVDGQPVDWDDITAIDPGMILRLPTGTQIYEGKQLDLSGFSLVQRDDLKELSATSRTPFATFSSDSANQSAEGAAQGEKPLIFKANERVRRFKPAADRVLWLGLAYSRTETGELLGADAPRVRSLWAPTERHTLGEQSQMVAQLKGVFPDEVIASKYLQFAPDELAELRRAASREAFRAQAVNQQPAATRKPVAAVDQADQQQTDEQQGATEQGVTS